MHKGEAIYIYGGDYTMLTHRHIGSFNKSTIMAGKMFTEKHKI